MILPLQNRRLARWTVKILLRLHNQNYDIISSIAIVAEGGIHPKHRLMDYHAFFVDNVRPQDIVLDIGCGNGFLTYDIAQKAREVVAIDLSKSNIEFAKGNFGQANIRYICGDATHMDFKEKFDIAVLSNVLEHIEDRIGFLRNLRDKAKRLLLRVPMVNRDWLTYYKRELEVKYFLDSTHKIEYILESLTEELEEAGLKIQKASIQFGEIWAVVTPCNNG